MLRVWKVMKVLDFKCRPSSFDLTTIKFEHENNKTKKRKEEEKLCQKCCNLNDVISEHPIYDEIFFETKLLEFWRWGWGEQDHLQS